MSPVAVLIGILKHKRQPRTDIMHNPSIYIYMSRPHRRSNSCFIFSITVPKAEGPTIDLLRWHLTSLVDWRSRSTEDCCWGERRSVLSPSLWSEYSFFCHYGLNVVFAWIRSIYDVRSVILAPSSPCKVLCSSFSATGLHFVTGCSDYVARVWTVTSQRTSEPTWVLKGHNDAVHCALFSNESDRLLTGYSVHLSLFFIYFQLILVLFFLDRGTEQRAFGL